MLILTECSFQQKSWHAISSMFFFALELDRLHDAGRGLYMNVCTEVEVMQILSSIFCLLMEGIAVLLYNNPYSTSLYHNLILILDCQEVVISVLMKLAGGCPSLADQLNVDAFLEQARSYDKAASNPVGWYIRLEMFSLGP